MRLLGVDNGPNALTSGASRIILQGPCVGATILPRGQLVETPRHFGRTASATVGALRTDYTYMVETVLGTLIILTLTAAMFIVALCTAAAGEVTSQRLPEASDLDFELRRAA